MTDRNDDYLAATEEWENVQEIVPEIIATTGEPRTTKSNHDTSMANLVPRTRSVTVEEVVDYYRAKDLSCYEDKIKPEKDRILFVWKFFGCFYGVEELPSHYHFDRNLIFCIAMEPFNNYEKIHLEILQTLYKQLTSTILDCPRYGSHWEQIGFQGTDPSTDLRGVGMLALVQALFLATEPLYARLADGIYRLSHHETQEFPMMVLSINVTRISLHALRDGILNGHVRTLGNVFLVFNKFYAGVMLWIFIKWKFEGKTIKDSGYVLKEAEDFSRNNVTRIFKRLEEEINKIGSS